MNIHLVISYVYNVAAFLLGQYLTYLVMHSLRVSVKPLYPYLSSLGHHQFSQHVLVTKVLISCDHFFTEESSGEGRATMRNILFSEEDYNWILKLVESVLLGRFQNII